jgi:hypothetical protein
MDHAGEDRRSCAARIAGRRFYESHGNCLGTPHGKRPRKILWERNAEDGVWPGRERMDFAEKKFLADRHAKAAQDRDLNSA